MNICQKPRLPVMFLFIFLVGVVQTVNSQGSIESRLLEKNKEQPVDPRTISDFIETQPTIKKEEYKYWDKLSLSEQVLALDRNIDENEYHVGPNDILAVYIWGRINKNFSAFISSEGHLIIPTVGVIDVNGKTLAEVKTLMRKEFRKIFKEKNISIFLVQIRSIKSYIMGDVVMPGAYTVNGVTRVSDLIEMAGGFLKEPDDEEKMIRKRGIEVVNEKNEIYYADMALFYHSNDISKNPYLKTGDRVWIRPRKEIVSVFGAVHFPGEFDFVEGDSLSTVIKAAGGLARGVDSTKILVTRFIGEKDSLVSFEISFLDSSAYSFVLNRDDRILACSVPEYRIHRKVTIKGEVKFPGVYPIRDDKTKLVDIIAKAGGLTEKAFLRGSKIVRKTNNRFGDREFDRLKKIPVENLQPLERSYLKTKLTEEEGIVSIDFEELLTNGSDLYNIILKDGDKITIAQKDLTVKVTGAVVSPGLVGFKEGAEYKYYIDQVGGFNTRSRKRSVMIIKGGTETWLKPRKVKKIEASDAVWVPEKEYRDRLQVTKDVLIILSSIATIVASYFTISKLMEE